MTKVKTLSTIDQKNSLNIHELDLPRKWVFTFSFFLSLLSWHLFSLYCNGGKKGKSKKGTKVKDYGMFIWSDQVIAFFQGFSHFQSGLQMLAGCIEVNWVTAQWPAAALPAWEQPTVTSTEHFSKQIRSEKRVFEISPCIWCLPS